MNRTGRRSRPDVFESGPLLAVLSSRPAIWRRHFGAVIWRRHSAIWRRYSRGDRDLASPHFVALAIRRRQSWKCRQKKRQKSDFPATRDDARSGIYEGVVANELQDVRCSACGKLLAKLHDGSLTLQRGDLQATFDGDFRASFICNRPSCRRLNVVRVRSHGEPSPAFAK